MSRRNFTSPPPAPLLPSVLLYSLRPFSGRRHEHGHISLFARDILAARAARCDLAAAIFFSPSERDVASIGSHTHGPGTHARLLAVITTVEGILRCHAEPSTVALRRATQDVSYRSPAI